MYSYESLICIFTVAKKTQHFFRVGGYTHRIAIGIGSVEVVSVWSRGLLQDSQAFEKGQVDKKM